MTYIHDERVFEDDNSPCVIETEGHIVHYENDKIAKQVLTYCENLGISLDLSLIHI